VYPREIEEFLHTHPAISEAQVVGVPDQRYGEAICACIRLRPGMPLTEDEVQAFCRGQIAHYKTPRYVRFVESFPMTVTGKVQKFLLRAAMIDDLGLDRPTPRA
jgi:fatty-acyl-CoA synthase